MPNPATIHASAERTLGDFERSQHGVDKQDGVDERNKPAAARSRFEVDANFSNGVFGFHGFPFSGDWLLAYTCRLSGLSGWVEKMASTGRSKYSAIWKASLRLGP